MSGALERITWLRNRLASMSGPEIVHRVREQALRQLGKRRPPQVEAGDGPLRMIPGLRDGVLALKDDPVLLSEWREVYERAQAGRFRFLGLDWPERANDPNPWHRDPVTGGLWARDAYCFDVPYRHAPGLGDVKFVWEVNRLQFLQPIAALAVATGDPAPARFCLETLASWLDANPPFRGVNWPSGIELALRIVSVTVVTSLLGPDAVPADLRLRLRASLAAHGLWLARFPSLHSSANNHRVAELAGLYLLGRLMPDLPDAKAWLREGSDGLVAEASRQILADGWGAEQSPTYAALTLEWYLLAAVVGERTGTPLPAPVLDVIGKAADALLAVTDRAGNQPRIGDDDDSAVLYSRTEPGGFVTSLTRAIAAVTGRADRVPPGARPHLRDAVFGRPAADPAPLAPGVVHLPQGGITAVREDVGGVEALWVLDHGPLGFLAIAAHGHADTLALWLHVDGSPVLVDAGTYAYHGDHDSRDAFRATRVHNTLCLEDRDSSEMTGAFNWGARAEATVHELRDAAASWRIDASHDGYVPAFGLTHRRVLEKTGDRTVRLVDRLEGQGSVRTVAIGFLVHPDRTLVERDGAFVVQDGDRGLLAIRHEGPLRPRQVRAWYSPAFGSRVEAVRLVFEGEMAPGAEVRTELTVLSYPGVS
ncbi:heparinase II/III domain-containing protein [Marinivivus vitaminiproducens]|uniref:heparinase II/III domain-containing protein n=1 Tax=Marinivivus vitaminiproducens TaxID=3035935 RepID=UPI0027A1A2CB|nr:alginate lyase family protein [Geminicoccaceae bacterium SCSIO 64248]